MRKINPLSLKPAQRISLSGAVGLRGGMSWVEDCAQQLGGHLLVRSVGGLGCAGGRHCGMSPLSIGNEPQNFQAYLLMLI